jgi:hypothetical protein
MVIATSLSVMNLVVGEREAVRSQPFKDVKPGHDRLSSSGANSSLAFPFLVAF